MGNMWHAMANIHSAWLKKRQILAQHGGQSLGTPTIVYYKNGRLSANASCLNSRHFNATYAGTVRSLYGNDVEIVSHDTVRRDACYRMLGCVGTNPSYNGKYAGEMWTMAYQDLRPASCRKRRRAGCPWFKEFTVTWRIFHGALLRAAGLHPASADDVLGGGLCYIPRHRRAVGVANETRRSILASVQDAVVGAPGVFALNFSCHMSWRAQMHQIRGRCRRLVGGHGAGMLWNVFMPPAAQSFEVMPLDESRWFYANTAHLARGSYRRCTTFTAALRAAAGNRTSVAMAQAIDRVRDAEEAAQRNGTEVISGYKLLSPGTRRYEPESCV